MATVTVSENQNHLIHEAIVELRKYQAVSLIAVTLGTGIVLVDSAAKFAHVHHGHSAEDLYLASSLIASFAPFLHLRYSRPTARQAYLLETLCASTDPTVVGLLLQFRTLAYTAGIRKGVRGGKLADSWSPYSTLADALTRLLPDVADRDYRTLGEQGHRALYDWIKWYITVEKQRRALNRGLMSGRQLANLPYLRVDRATTAALDLVARVGDKHALPALRKLASFNPPDANVAGALNRALMAVGGLR